MLQDDPPVIAEVCLFILLQVITLQQEIARSRWVTLRFD